MVKKDFSKKPQEPKSFASFLRKRAPIYLGLLGLFFIFAYPAITEKNLDSLLDDSFVGDEKIAVDTVKFYKGPNDTGISIIEVIEEKINEKYIDQKIFDNEKTSASFVVESIPTFLEASNDFTHQVIFKFNAENEMSSLEGSLTYGWFVNVKNGEVFPMDDDAKNIQQTVEYFD